MARERDDYDDEDRPRRRDDEYTDRPRRARRDEDEDEDDRPRPRRRRRDEDDDDFDYDVRRRPRELTGLDATFANTNIVMLVLFSLFCGGIAFILGVIGLCTCKDELARRNALITTIIGGILTGLGVVVQVLGNL
jgi:hypothetical protein